MCITLSNGPHVTGLCVLLKTQKVDIAPACFIVLLYTIYRLQMVEISENYLKQKA